MSDAQSFFLKLSGKTTGPHTRDEIAHMVHERTLSPIHKVSLDEEHWQPLHEIEEWRDVWNGGGSSQRYMGSPTEPPPLPIATQEQPHGDKDENEPLDVELL